MKVKYYVTLSLLGLSVLFNLVQLNKTNIYKECFYEETKFAAAEFELLHKIYMLDKKKWESYKSLAEYIYLEKVNGGDWEDFYAEY